VLPVLSLLTVVGVSLVVTRVAGMALAHTGLSPEVAHFQARSAFSGVGFTTTESEKIVNHPLRRRITVGLMIGGNAGFVTSVSSLVLTFLGPGPEPRWLRVGALGAGLVALGLVARSRRVDAWLSDAVDRFLARQTKLDVRDYASLLRLSGRYRVAELEIRAEDWIAGRTLEAARLGDEGLVVLGVARADGTYLGTPSGDRVVYAGDELILYGRVEAIEGLDERVRGEAAEAAHAAAVEAQRSVQAEERLEDDERRAPAPRRAERR
jgi:hypothetical protein